MLYPLLFKPILKKLVWGTESWDICIRPGEDGAKGDMSIIENGPLAGMSLHDAIMQDREAYLGTRLAKQYRKRGFPLLVKIIEAHDDLSVQVHPGFGNDAKNEMWYILKAKPNQEIVLGVTTEATGEILKRNPTKCLRYMPINAGDIINIPAGLVHALTGGVKLAEIQQNSDTTYRLYDYGRLGLDGFPRELHLKEGVGAIDFTNPSHSPPQFVVKKFGFDGEFRLDSDPETFTTITCVEGSCTINGVALPLERSCFVPAGIGAYVMKGKATLLFASIPNPNSEEDEE